MTATPKQRLLIVEDEAAIRRGLVDLFVFHGFDVDAADEGPSGLSKAQSGDYDLILLDVMLPGIDGFEICDRIRQSDPQQPIIMLTAKSTDEDIINGLRLGADDYVAKPFSVAQLVLRVQAVLRRSVPPRPECPLIVLDHITVDTLNLSGQKEDDEVRFTRREMDIVQYLALHSERPVPREELLSKVWGYAEHLDIETRTVDIHIAKLRRKIEPEPAKPTSLITIRGAGYRLLLKDDD